MQYNCAIFVFCFCFGQETHDHYYRYHKPFSQHCEPAIMFWDRISFLRNFQNITVITCPIYCLGRHAISSPTSDQPDLKNVVLTKVIFFVASKLARPSLTFPDDSHKSQSTIIDSCCRHSKKIMHRKDACTCIYVSSRELRN